MRILVLCSNYYPESLGVAPMCTELCEDLARMGHEVTALTAFPCYPERRVTPEYRGRWFQREERRGVRILRSYMFISKSKARLPRLLSYSSFMLSCLWSALRSGPQDVVLTISSPLPLGLSGWLISRTKGVPHLFAVADLFVEVAVRLGLLRGEKMTSLAKKLEHFIYTHCEQITVVCDAFKSNLAGKGVPAEKITVIYNWVDLEQMHPAERMNAFRAEFNLGDGFLVMYAGNLGLFQGLDTIVEAADLTRDDPRITYVFVGDGLKQPDLVQFCQSRGLANVRFIPVQPRERALEFTAAGDVHLAALDQGMQFSFPSKIPGIMAVGRPIVAMVEQSTDAARIIQESAAGIVLPPRRPDLLAATLRDLLADRHGREEMGAAGIRYAANHFSRQRATALYEELLRML